MHAFKHISLKIKNKSACTVSVHANKCIYTFYDVMEGYHLMHYLICRLSSGYFLQHCIFVAPVEREMDDSTRFDSLKLH